jgi:hypothetical protein
MNTLLGWLLLCALAGSAWVAWQFWPAGPLVALLVGGLAAGAAMTAVGALAFFFDPAQGRPGTRFGEAHLRRR